MPLLVPRPEISRNGHGDDLLESEPLESQADRFSRSFRRIPLSPVLASKPPTHFDRTRNHVGLVEAGDPDELRSIHYFDGPQPPTTLRNQSARPIDRRIVLLARANPTQVAHHLRIGVDRCVRPAILIAPLTEQHSHRGPILQSACGPPGVSPEPWLGEDQVRRSMAHPTY